jgi:hypothetical protein
MATAMAAMTMTTARAHVRFLVAAVPAPSPRDGRGSGSGWLTFTWLTLVSLHCQISALTLASGLSADSRWMMIDGLLPHHLGTIRAKTPIPSSLARPMAPQAALSETHYMAIETVSRERAHG